MSLIQIPPDAPLSVQQAFRGLADEFDRWNGTVVDLEGRRFANAGRAVQAQDFITRADLLSTLEARGVDKPDTTDTTVVREPGPPTPAVGATVTVNTFANRPVANERGALFFASDQDYVCWVSTGAAWKYAAGVFSGTLSPDQTPTLGTDDAGYRFRSTDFAREYTWSGSAWADAPGTPQRGMVAHFLSGQAPSTGWQLCDGSSGVAISTATGGTSTVTVPDLTTNTSFIRAVAGATGGTGGAAATHTHQVDPTSTASGTPSATTTVDNDGGGSTVAVGSDVHTHATDIAAFASAGPSGASGDDGLPPYLDMRPYFRL